MHKFTLINGLLEEEGGISMSGVSREMVLNLRELLQTLSALCEALKHSDASKDPDIEPVYHRAEILLKYLRESKKTISREITDEQTKQ